MGSNLGGGEENESSPNEEGEKRMREKKFSVNSAKNIRA